MRAKCINDQSEEYPNYLGKLSPNKLAGLTKDKLYEAEQSKQYDGYFEVINDLGIKENYKKERFEVMEDNIRKCSNTKCDSNHHGICICFPKRVECKNETENKCYNKECKRNNKNGLCLLPYLECKYRNTEQPAPISLEEECEKLKEENEELEKDIKKYNDYEKRVEKEKTELIRKLKLYKGSNEEIAEKSIKEYDKLKALLAASEDHNKIFSEENERLKLENKELQVMISDQDKSANELREELQQSNFKLKEYETKLPQIKSLVIKLVDINKILASNIYVEELED